MSEFLTPLITKSVRPGWARVVEAFMYQSNEGGLIIVPAGFEFDWDSVPRIPGIHAALKGRAERSACIHDWLYYSGEVDRKMADDIFLEAMKAEGTGLLFRHPIYWGVRAGGGPAWRRHRERGDYQGILA